MRSETPLKKGKESLDSFKHVDDGPETVGTADHGLPLLLGPRIVPAEHEHPDRALYRRPRPVAEPLRHLHVEVHRELLPLVMPLTRRHGAGTLDRARLEDLLRIEDPEDRYLHLRIGHGYPSHPTG